VSELIRRYLGMVFVAQVSGVLVFVSAALA
jgi:hypothetical protein